jgi:hypothetical protein
MDKMEKDGDIRSEWPQSEWRKLGFYYDIDESSKEWLLIGSRFGLRRFSGLLREYSADSRNAKMSEHEHIGPYMDIEVMTWTEAGMDGHAIFGTLKDLRHLAALVDRKIATLEPGQKARIREEFAASAE